jgi:hypothetical protein
MANGAIEKSAAKFRVGGVGMITLAVENRIIGSWK